jgi:two-component system, NarL family, invasion response regulator UvrY
VSTIYLVDDHAMLRDGLRAVLAAAGHHIAGEAVEPTQALADILSLRPELLVLDLSLAQRSGLELLAELQRRKVALHCIVLTMSSQPRHVAEALRLGAVGYVLKGSSTGELLQAIQVAMAGGRFLGSDVAELAQRALSEPDDASALVALSHRERQIVVLVVGGRSSTEIGALLHLSPKTVDSYRSRLMVKIGVRDVPSLVRFAIRTGLADTAPS